MRVTAMMLVLLVVSAPLGGCFGEEKVVVVEKGVFEELCPEGIANNTCCLLYTSPSPRDRG